jgi:glutamate-1-semialdehyde aminotransferase
MSGMERVDDWFEQLLGINADAFAAGRYEVAYHALMAALHAAQDASDPSHLRRVQQLADQQQDRIDAEAPRHRLASDVARRHGVIGIFRMAARQASARAAIVQRDHGATASREAMRRAPDGRPC